MKKITLFLLGFMLMGIGASAKITVTQLPLSNVSPLTGTGRLNINYYASFKIATEPFSIKNYPSFKIVYEDFSGSAYVGATNASKKRQQFNFSKDKNELVGTFNPQTFGNDSIITSFWITGTGTVSMMVKKIVLIDKDGKEFQTNYSIPQDNNSKWNTKFYPYSGTIELALWGRIGGNNWVSTRYKEGEIHEFNIKLNKPISTTKWYFIYKKAGDSKETYVNVPVNSTNFSLDLDYDYGTYMNIQSQQNGNVLDVASVTRYVFDAAELNYMDSVKALAYHYYINSLAVDSTGDTLRKALFKYMGEVSERKNLHESSFMLDSLFHEYLLCEGIEPSQNLYFDVKDMNGYGIQNASFDNNSGWESLESTSYATDSVANLKGNGKILQTIILPRTGKYVLRSNAFAQQLTKASDSYTKYNTGNANVQSKMVLSIYTKPTQAKSDSTYETVIKNLFEEYSDASMIPNDKNHNEYKVAANYWVPQTTTAAKLYFDKGLYTNDIVFQGKKGQTAFIALESLDAWVCADNFRLQFYGTMPTVDHSLYGGNQGNSDKTNSNAGNISTGIKTTVESANINNIYTITGQKVEGNVNTLNKGLYIINGRKIIFK